MPLVIMTARALAGHSPRFPLLLAVLGAGLLLGLCELGQAFLPGRTADAKDLLWGALGILLGAVVVLLIGARGDGKCKEVVGAMKEPPPRRGDTET